MSNSLRRAIAEYLAASAVVSDFSIKMDLESAAKRSTLGSDVLTGARSNKYFFAPPAIATAISIQA